MINPEVTLPRELYPERDLAIRKFCIAIQAFPSDVPEEWADDFFAAIRDIAYRAIIKRPNIYPYTTPEDREDIVIQAALDFYRAVYTYKFIPKPEIPVAPYVARCVTTAGLKLVYEKKYQKDRTERARHDAVNDWMGSVQPQDHQSVEEEVEERVLIRQVTQALQKLSPAQRAVMELLPFFSREEICEKLKIRRNQLRLRVQKARKKLRKMFPDAFE